MRIKKYQLKGMTKYLCNCLGISTPGYYNYLKNEEKRQKRDEQDKKDYELILKAYKYKNRKKGAETNEILAYHLSESLELDISKDDSCIIQKSSS